MLVSSTIAGEMFSILNCKADIYMENYLGNIFAFSNDCNKTFVFDGWITYEQHLFLEIETMQMKI